MIRTGFYGDKVRLLKLVTRNGVCAIFGDIFENQSALIDLTRLLRYNGVDWRFARDGTEEHGVRVPMEVAFKN